MKQSSILIKQLATALFAVIFISLTVLGQNTNKRKKVEIQTKYGTMVVELYNETPKHRDNFIKLAKEKFYDDLIFHRVIRNFMIQGGDPNSRNAAPNIQLGNGGPGYQIDAEILPKFIHKKGALSAARLGDQINPQKQSSGSQFYVVQGTIVSRQELMNFQQRSRLNYTEEQIKTYTTTGGTPHLDGAYTVFGEVIKGLEVIDKIAAQPTVPGDRPVENIVMKVRIIE